MTGVPLYVAFLLPLGLVLLSDLFLFVVVCRKLVARDHRRLSENQKGRRVFGLVGEIVIFALLGKLISQPDSFASSKMISNNYLLLK